jgi:hypothetical protein
MHSDQMGGNTVHFCKVGVLGSQFGEIDFFFVYVPIRVHVDFVGEVSNNE